MSCVCFYVILCLKDMSVFDNKEIVAKLTDMHDKYVVVPAEKS